MSTGVKTIIYPVSDLATAKEVFGALAGAEPDQDQPYYVAYTVDGQHIGLNPNGHKEGMTGPVAFWHVDDLDASVQLLLDRGGERVGETQQYGNGRRVASVRDQDGNVFGFIQDA
jgi:predicted enzyme related to lactoylglutathione lyase